MDQSAFIRRRLYFQQNAFEIRIIKNPTEILIEAENLENEKLYFRTFNESDIKQFDSVFYNDVATFHRALKEGFEGGHDHIQAIIDENALVTLLSKFKVAGKDRKTTTEMQLNEKKLSPLKECERFLTKLDDQKPESWGYSEQHFSKILKRVIEMQGIMEERLEAMPQNGYNSDLAVEKKDQSKEIKELIDHRVDEQMEELREFVVERLAKAEQNIASLQESQTEITQKLDDSFQKVASELLLVKQRQKELENTISQISEAKEPVEPKGDKNSELTKLSSIVEGIRIKSETFADSLEELKAKLVQVEEDQRGLSNQIKQIMQGQEGEAKPDNNGLRDSIYMKSFVDEMSRKMGQISESMETQKEKMNEFLKMNSDTENKLTMLRGIYSKAEERLKILEEEARELIKIQDRLNIVEEISFGVDKKNKDLVPGPKQDVLNSKERMPPKNNSKPTVQIQAEFKPNIFDGDLKFTQNNRAVESPLGILFDRTLFGQNPLPKSGKFSVSIKYENVTRGAHSLMVIGLAIASLRDTGCILAPGCFFLAPFEKTAYINGMEVSYEAGYLKPEDVICITVDQDENSVRFEINGLVMAEGQLNPEYFENLELYPCIHLQQCRDLKISFV